MKDINERIYTGEQVSEILQIISYRISNRYDILGVYQIAKQVFEEVREKHCSILLIKENER